MTLHRPIKAMARLLPPAPGGAGDVFGKGGSTGTGGVEAPDTLRSHQVAKIIDALGEGPNRGIVGFTKGIYFDGVPVQNADGSYNFSNAILQQVLGYPDQPVIAGFESQSSEVGVGAKVLKDFPVNRNIGNTNVDRVRITVSTPSLQVRNDETGDISGTTIQFELLVQNNGGGFQPRGTFKISGKTTSTYQRAIVLDLPRPGPWDIRVRRITADGLDPNHLANDLYWDSFTEIIDAKVNYTLTHCVGLIIDAEQFQSIPARTYLVDGRLVLIPSNYDPDARTYAGVWDGTFEVDWTNNPAWVLYDMVVNSRYGLGAFLGAGDIDKWALYEIAQWCDQPVPDGRGGFEPRFVCNVCINTRSEAFDLLARLCSAFRGFSFWDGGKLVAVADQPRSVGGIYTHANVLNGRFEYSGADVRGMHNMVLARWADPTNLGEGRLAIAEDAAAISRNGILDTAIEAVGATTEGQALRAGRWLLFTENYEAETVQFGVGLQGAWCKPGDIIAIADRVIGGERRGGRVVAATQTEVTLDAPVEIAEGQTGFLSVVVGEGLVETLRVVTLEAGPHPRLSVFGSYSEAPAPNAVWVLATGDLETTLWRVLTVSEADPGYVVLAIAHRPDKWGHVENNLPLSTPLISSLQATPPAVTNMRVEEALVRAGAGSVGVTALLSWTSRSPAFDVDARADEGNWERQRVQTTAVDIAVTEGWWNFQVTPVNAIGRKGPTQTIRKEIIGRYAPPGPPLEFRIVVNQGMALFRWLPATELDVIVGGHYELRFLPRTTGEMRWEDGQTIIASIPGSSTSAEAFYQVGTYMLRTFDAIGIASETYAVITVDTPDTQYVAYVQICESPDWEGLKEDVEVEPVNDWLIISEGAATGTYYFDQRIDLGAPFTTRLSWDMLAFPFYPGDETIDERVTNVDSWQNWDAALGDLSGTVRLEVRQTDADPTLGGWSEWRSFSAGEHTGRAFEFRAILTAPPGQNVAIESLCILADIRNKIDEGGDVPYPAAKQTIPFNIDFFSPPAITITIQEALAGDHVVLSNKTNTTFDIEILSAAGAQLTRTFDWHAMGY